MFDNIYRPLQENDFINAEVEELSSIPAGSNPYTYDRDRSGICIPKGWEIMYEASSPGALEELVLVNHFTGQRLKVHFTAKSPQLLDILQENRQRDIRYVSGSVYMPDVRSDGSIRWEVCDDIDVSDMLDNLYTVWWGQKGVYFVKVKLFLDVEKFPQTLLRNFDEETFDGNRLYPDDVLRLKAMLDKYGPGPTPATAKNVTAKPFGLNE